MMNRTNRPSHGSHIRLLLTVALAASTLTSARAQTRAFLDAPLVKNRLRVKWNTSQKKLQYAIDKEQTMRALPDNATFVTKRSIYVVYSQFNPLRLKTSVTTKTVADPNFTSVKTLYDALMTAIGAGLQLPDTGATGAAVAARTAAVAAATVAAAPAACSNPASDIRLLQQDLDDLQKLLDGTKGEVAKWPDEVDAAFRAGKSGPDAISVAVSALNDFTAKIDNAVKKIDEWRKKFKDCANDIKVPADIQAAYALAQGWDPTGVLVKIADLRRAVAQYSSDLKKDYGDDAWSPENNTDLVISKEILPTYSDMQSVTVRVIGITFKTDPPSAFATSEDEIASVVFTVRKYSTVATEIGVGAVFGWVKQPTYGTSTNADGKTIVAKKPDKSLSTNGAVLANFVYRGTSSLLVPMVQVGANASKDLPAIFVGGGFRLFNLPKGDLAIGGGIMAAWYKDLDKLHPEDVISGTNDINTDLKLIDRPKFGPYFVIQYKF